MDADVLFARIFQASPTQARLPKRQNWEISAAALHACRAVTRADSAFCAVPGLESNHSL